jgi:hypothetical protein
MALGHVMLRGFFGQAALWITSLGPQIVASDQPTADVAAGVDYPVRVLIEPLGALLLSSKIRFVRSGHVSPPSAPTSARSTQPLVTNDVVCSIHCRPGMRIKESCGCFDTLFSKVC